MLALATIAALLSGCGSPVDVAVPRTLAGDSIRPVFDMSGMDCQLAAVVCAAIQDGAKWLAQHPSGTCNWFGVMALGLINDQPGKGGFRIATLVEEAADGGQSDMGVPMDGPGKPTLSEYASTDNYVIVYRRFINNVSGGGTYSWSDVGSLLAHEVGGHISGDDNPNHTTGRAYLYQNEFCPREF
jgi:hypothetical protein